MPKFKPGDLVKFVGNLHNIGERALPHLKDILEVECFLGGATPYAAKDYYSVITESGVKLYAREFALEKIPGSDIQDLFKICGYCPPPRRVIPAHSN